MLVNLKQIFIPPGNILQLKDVNWQLFESILEELGESRVTRLTYNKGLLEIMNPLPEHEDDKEIIGDLVKIILEALNLEYRSLGSTTFKKEQESGIEPAQCFYIQNEAKVRGKKRLNLMVDPPPDLVIEIDITSRTQLNVYETLKVPEIWRYNGEYLQISILQEDKYIDSQTSLIFPNLLLTNVIPEYVERCQVMGRLATLKSFKNWLREQLSSTSKS
ncbi:MAG: Uma2 family endonuclease [Symploca sp. SIO2E9]|nr:Uma2 family endonuclease [Symploca sp. SIO2E9]